MLSTMSLSSMLSVYDEEHEAERRYTEELAFVDRKDGVGLEGAIIRPRGKATRPVAIVWIHGNTSRYYDLPYMQIGRELAALGYTFITSSTDGQEDGTSLDGVCRESFDEVPLDLTAWIDMAMEEGFQGVVLVGHSFGANKVLYYQAVAQDPRVLGVVSASGDMRWRVSEELVEIAEAMEAAGRGNEVLPQVDSPWCRMSAKAYLSRARIAQHVFSSHTTSPFISKVTCPILAFYGSEEDWCGTEHDLDVVRHNARSAAYVDSVIIEGADHVYWGKAAVAASLIARWTDELLDECSVLAA